MDQNKYLYYFLFCLKYPATLDSNHQTYTECDILIALFCFVMPYIVSVSASLFYNHFGNFCIRKYTQHHHYLPCLSPPPSPKIKTTKKRKQIIQRYFNSYLRTCNQATHNMKTLETHNEKSYSNHSWLT